MIKLSGKIKDIEDAVVYGNFEKRRFRLTEVVNGSDRVPNVWDLELWKEDINLIDGIQEGQYITCFIDIKGREFPPEKSKDGKKFWINTLKCWNIERDGVLKKPIRQQ